MYIYVYVAYLIFPTEIPPVKNLTVADQCTSIIANWSTPEGPCIDLSYSVTLLSSNGTKLQGPYTTNDTVYNFTNVEALNGVLNVTVVSIGNVSRGANVTEMAVANVSQGGQLCTVYLCKFMHKEFFTENKQSTSCVCTCVYREANYTIWYKHTYVIKS